MVRVILASLPASVQDHAMGKGQIDRPCRERLGIESLFSGCWEGIRRVWGVEREREEVERREAEAASFWDRGGEKGKRGEISLSGGGNWEWAKLVS